MSETIGVLMMAYGGPECLEDLPGYLSDIRYGRTTSKRILNEITENYANIQSQPCFNVDHHDSSNH